MNRSRHEVDDRSASDDPKRVCLPKNHEKYAGNDDHGGHRACDRCANGRDAATKRPALANTTACWSERTRG